MCYNKAMKRIIALLTAVLAALCVCVGAPAAAPTQDGVIYDNSSSGPMVVRIQMRLRELGYLNFKPTGSYRGMTAAAAKAFQINYRDSGYDVMVDGKIGPQSLEYLFMFNALRVSLADVSIPSGPRNDTLAATGNIVSWSEVMSMLRDGESYSVVDCYTGVGFDLVFTGGANHAEMEAATAEDALNFNYICGSAHNYLKRPIVITIDGQPIAASIQCYPHGDDSVADNDMAGHVCVFFEGSVSHVGSLPDVEHSENIYIAAGQ